MYQISTKDGVVGCADAVTCCYRLPSGSPQVIGRKERARGETPTGVIYGGAVYNLSGHADFDAETAAVSEIDGGRRLSEQGALLAAHEAAAADTDAMLVDQELRLTLLELGVKDDAV